MGVLIFIIYGMWSRSIRHSKSFAVFCYIRWCLSAKRPHSVPCTKTSLPSLWPGSTLNKLSRLSSLEQIITWFNIMSSTIRMWSKPHMHMATSCLSSSSSIAIHVHARAGSLLTCNATRDLLYNFSLVPSAATLAGTGYRVGWSRVHV